MCVPAVEILSGMSFTVAGSTVTKHRALQIPAKWDELLFIHDNYEYSAPSSISTATSST